MYDLEIIPRLAQVRKANETLFGQSAVASDTGFRNIVKISSSNFPPERSSRYILILLQKKIVEELMASKEKFWLAMEATSDGL